MFTHFLDGEKKQVFMWSKDITTGGLSEENK